MGAESSLVNEVFRLIDYSKQKPNWVLLENVPFMLCLDSGRAMRLITTELSRRGYRWAYRTVNARAFGVPQRRLRVVVLASLDSDPSEVIFADDKGEPSECDSPEGFGFYWTEGATGLGWARNCVPTLKGGSTIGIPSPPAIWIPSERRLATIDIRDAERLQGFPVNWTKPAMNKAIRPGARWRLVGNAVCVRVASWIGKRLASPGRVLCKEGPSIEANGRWPSAAYGDQNGSREILASMWPIARTQTPLLEFLRFPLRPLSARATAGFLSRAKKSSLRFEHRFLDDVEHHLNSVNSLALAADAGNS
jgi:DNA (cytosine-5)-methyltransferase 1